MRRRFPAALVLVLAGCSGGASPPADPTAAQKGSARAARPPALSATAPLMKMASGTDHVDGVLAVWCEAKRCKRAAGARPIRYLPGKANGLLLFESSVVPASAEVEIRGTRGRVLSRGALEPGTTMAYVAPALGSGRFRVVLFANWTKREGRWVFGLRGPLGG